MIKSISFAVCLCLLVFGINRSMQAQDQVQGRVLPSAKSFAESSDREQDGLNGPVRRLRVETAKILLKEGRVVEAPHVLREISTYDPKGRKMDGVAYPVEGSTLPGKEQYQYDDKGNIVEMILRADDGSILSKEKYDYEFDEFGNWKKMTSSIGIYESGKSSYEPVEVTYRLITYYYNQLIDKVASSLSKSSEGSGSTAKAGLPAGEPKTAPAPASATEAKHTIKDEVSSARVDPKVKKSEIKDTTTVATTQRDNTAIENRHTGTMVAPPAASSNNALSTKYVPEEVLHKKVKLEEGTPASISVKQPATPSAAELSPPTSSSNTAASLYKKGLSFLASGRHAEAVEALKQVTQADPNDAIAYEKLGLAYSGLHQYKETVAVLTMAIRIKREVVDAEGYYQLGQAYIALGKHSDALGAFKQALYITRALVMDPAAKVQRFPSLEDIRYALALTHHNMAHYIDAIKELQQVIAANPKFEEAYYGLVMSYVALGDRKSAEKQQKILSSLNPALGEKAANALSPPSRILPPGVNRGRP
jgi:Flp pilus assembly protein TadD